MCTHTCTQEEDFPARVKTCNDFGWVTKKGRVPSDQDALVRVTILVIIRVIRFMIVIVVVIIMTMSIQSYIYIYIYIHIRPSEQARPSRAAGQPST